MCEEVQVDGMLEVKPYACPPWVSKPEVVVWRDEEQALAMTEDYKPGQVDIYVDASVPKAGRESAYMPGRQKHPSQRG
jgi:hypothetical protein